MAVLKVGSDWHKVGCEAGVVGRLRLILPSDGTMLGERRYSDTFRDASTHGPLEVFGWDVGTNAYDLTYTVPDSVNSFMTVNFGMASSDLSPPAEFHRLVIGEAFGGNVQFQYRNSSGTLSAYYHLSQPVTLAPGDEIRVRITPEHFYCYVNGVQVEDAPPLTSFTGDWLVIDTANGDSGSTTTVDDLSIKPLGRPLKIEDSANPGTWITVACMLPADTAAGIGVYDTGLYDTATYG